MSVPLPNRPSSADLAELPRPSIAVLMMRGVVAVTVVVAAACLLRVLLPQPTPSKVPDREPPAWPTAFAMQDLLGGEWEFADRAQQVRLIPVPDDADAQATLASRLQTPIDVSIDQPIERGGELLEVLQGLGAKPSYQGAQTRWILRRGSFVAHAVSKQVDGVDQLYFACGIIVSDGKSYVIEVRGGGGIETPNRNLDESLLPLPAETETIAVRRDSNGVCRGQLLSLVTSLREFRARLKNNDWRTESLPDVPHHLICWPSVPDTANRHLTYVLLIPQGRQDVGIEFRDDALLSDPSAAPRVDADRKQHYLAIVTSVPDEGTNP